MIRVGWIFSLVRSGSSAAAYASAAPWDLPVADELFGPWDRTGTPYHMPERQPELVRAFRATGHTLSADIVGLADELFRELAERDESGRGLVISKCPHLMFTPEQFETWFGQAGSSGVEHKAVYLIRNPLRRVNSCYARGWENLLNDPFEMGVYRTFMARWLNAEHRVRFEDLLADPASFFGALYEAWGFDADAEAIEKACAYAAEHYHESSAQIDEHREGDRPLSEVGWSAPREVLDAYLADDEIVAFMAEQGWPTKRRAYEPGLATRLWRAFSAG